MGMHDKTKEKKMNKHEVYICFFFTFFLKKSSMYTLLTTHEQILVAAVYIYIYIYFFFFKKHMMIKQKKIFE